MIKRYFGLMSLVCALAGFVSAQNTTTFGNIVSQGTPCGSSNCVYYQLPPATPWVVITVTGTWAGTLETATTSAPNANYSNLSTLAWTALATSTANGTWSASTRGATYLRVRATSWASGSAHVAMASDYSLGPLINPVFPGTVTATGLQAAAGGSPSNCWLTNGTTGSCAGASYPGVTSNGASGLNAQGLIAASSFRGRGTGFFANQKTSIFGDSITALPCVGVSSLNCWASLVGGSFNLPQDYGNSGDQAADQVFNQIYPNLNPHYYAGGQSIGFIGVNDANVCVVTNGGGTGCYNNYFHTYLSGAAWASIGLENKIIPQLAVGTAQCATTGTWTNQTYQTNVAAVQSIVPGSTITCTTLDPAATGLYVNWAANDAWTSSAALAIDGTTVDTLNGFGFNGTAINTFHALTQTAFASRYGIAAGSTHTFTITVNTAGSSNPFMFLWAGSPASSTPTSMANITQGPPAFAVGAVIPQIATGANITASANMDVQAQLVASTLAGDGAFVTYIPTRNFINTTTDYTSTTETLPNGQSYCGSSSAPIHPNCLGQQHIADSAVATLLPLGGSGSSGFKLQQLSIFTSYTLVGGESLIYDQCPGACTLTLPSTGLSTGYGQTIFVNNFGGNGTLTISGGAGGGTVSLQLFNRGDWAILTSAANNWFVVSTTAIPNPLTNNGVFPFYEAIASSSTAQGSYGSGNNGAYMTVNRLVNGNFTDATKNEAHFVCNAFTGGTTSNCQIATGSAANTTNSATHTFDNTGINMPTGETYKINGQPLGLPLSSPIGAPTFTPGTNITSVVCASGYTCGNTHGELTIVANGSATTGTIAQVNFNFILTTAPGLCLVTQVGGAADYIIGHDAATTTGFHITAGATVVSATVTVDYFCQL